MSDNVATSTPVQRPTKFTARRFVRECLVVDTPFGEIDAGVPYNMGGTSLVFNVDVEALTLEIFWSVCRRDENFDKSIGIAQALAKPPIKTIYDPTLTLVDNLIEYFIELEDVESTVPKEMQALMRDLQEFYIGDWE